MKTRPLAACFALGAPIGGPPPLRVLLTAIVAVPLLLHPVAPLLAQEAQAPDQVEEIETGPESSQENDRPADMALVGFYAHYGENGTEQASLGLWTFSYAALGRFGLTQIRHENLGDLYGLEGSIELALPIYRIFPSAGLGIILGSGGDHPLMATLYPSIAINAMVVERLFLSVSRRFHFSTTGPDDHFTLTTVEIAWVFL